MAVADFALVIAAGDLFANVDEEFFDGSISAIDDLALNGYFQPQATHGC